MFQTSSKKFALIKVASWSSLSPYQNQFHYTLFFYKN